MAYRELVVEFCFSQDSGSKGPIIIPLRHLQMARASTNKDPHVHPSNSLKHIYNVRNRHFNWLPQLS